MPIGNLGNFIPSLENFLFKVFAHFWIMLEFPCCCKSIRILYSILFLTGSHCDTQAGLELRIFMLSILRDPFFEGNSAVSQGCMKSRKTGLLPWELCGMKHGSSSAHAHWPFYCLYRIETAWDLPGERVDTKAVLLEFLASRPSANTSSERVVISVDGKVRDTDPPD